VESPVQFNKTKTQETLVLFPFLFLQRLYNAETCRFRINFVDRRKLNKNILLLSLEFLLLLTHYRSKFFLYINNSRYATTTIIMKFCAAAVRLLFLGSCSLLTESVTNALADEDDKMILPTPNLIHRSLQRNNAKGGKKGNNKGGKKAVTSTLWS
jgi:hypothetical protein